MAEVSVQAGGAGSSGSSGSSGAGANLLQIVPIPNGTSVVDTTPQYGNNSIFYDYTASDCTSYVSGRVVVVFNQGATIYYNVNPVVGFGPDGESVSFTATLVSGFVNLNIIVPSSNWNLNLSKIVFLDLCTPAPYECPAIATENGDDLITESGDIITIECTPPSDCPIITTENGDDLITESGNTITIECTPTTANFITTQNNDPLLTENGFNIITQ